MENQNLKQESLSPFDVEKIEEIKHTNVEIKDDQLLIDGVIQGKYSNVDDKRLQKNNSNLVYFNASMNGAEEGSWAGRVIDVNNPEKELLEVKTDKKDDTILVNGSKWDSLRGKDVYFGGYHVEIDPQGEKIVFTELGKDKSSIIVNNTEWQTKFKGVQFATSSFGVVYAIVDNDFYEHTRLLVDDKEWVYPKFSAELNQQKDHVVNATIGKNDLVVAIVDSIRTKDRRSHVLTGDKIGAKNEWKNTLNQVKKIITDNETGNVAVFGETEYNSKEMAFIINDMPYQIEDMVGDPEVFKFEGGAVLIQYLNALGEKISKKITLRENAKEVQKMKEKKLAEEKAFENLRHMLTNENITASEIVARLNQVGDLEKKIEEVKNLHQTVDKLTEEKIGLKLKIEKDNTAHEKEKEALELKITETQKVVGELKDTLTRAEKTTFGSNFKISNDSMKLALKSLIDLEEKYGQTKNS